MSRFYTSTMQTEPGMYYILDKNDADPFETPVDFYEDEYKRADMVCRQYNALVDNTVDFLINLVGESGNPENVNLDLRADDYIYSKNCSLSSDIRFRLVSAAIDEYNAL